jgi:hypothetical protein
LPQLPEIGPAGYQLQDLNGVSLVRPPGTCQVPIRRVRS